MKKMVARTTAETAGAPSPSPLPHKQKKQEKEEKKAKETGPGQEEGAAGLKLKEGKTRIR